MGDGAHRVGIGSDLHELTDGGPLILGGVHIDTDLHLLGHSDADVVLHAITDALLGALGAGDIGDLFPDSDPINKGRDSADFVGAADQLRSDQRWNIDNVDVIVQAQRPKLVSYKQLMREKIASLLRIDSGQVNVKAKTGESLGVIGRGEAIAAWAVVSLSRDA